MCRPDHLLAEANHPWQVDCVFSLHIITYVIASSHFFPMCFQCLYFKKMLEKVSKNNALPFSHEALFLLSLFLSCLQQVSTNYWTYISNSFLRCWLFCDSLAPCLLLFCWLNLLYHADGMIQIFSVIFLFHGKKIDRWLKMVKLIKKKY